MVTKNDPHKRNKALQFIIKQGLYVDYMLWLGELENEDLL